MNRAQPKSSPTDQHARSIAAAIAKGRPPALTPELDQYFESSPRDIFVAFEGVARHMPPGGHDETLALGYLFLLQQLLERLRYRTDRGYADAARLIADFQADVAARVEAGQIDGHMLAYVGGALHQSKIPASPELAKASARQHVNDARADPFPTMSTPLSQVSLKPAGMIRLGLSARWSNSVMPCRRRTAVPR